MKIDRFNESSVLSPHLSKKVNDFIDDFNGSIDNDIFDWIDTVSDITKLDEYKNFTYSNDNVVKLANDKGLKKLKEYAYINSEIIKLESKLQLLNDKLSFLHVDAASETLYKFQEDLINNDFDGFYKVFLDDDNGLSDVHPEILDKYEKEIKIKMDSKKYNI